MSRLPDPLGPALAVVASVIFWLRGFDGELTRDLALYAYAGQQVASGNAPYVGVMNRSGPLAHLVPGAGVWAGNLLGVDDLLAIRVTLLVVSALVVWLSYLLARDVFGSKPIGAAAALFVATIPGFIYYAAGGPRDKTTMMLFLVAALLATVGTRWVLAGVCLALATLTWQPAFLPGIAAVVVAALLSTRRRVAAVAWVGIAATITMLVFVAGFAAVGALPDALDGFIRIHLRDTYQPAFIEEQQETWRMITEAFGHATSTIIAGLVLLPVVAVPGAVRLARRRTTSSQGRVRDVALVAATAGALAGVAWSYHTFNGWADALVLVPFAAMGLAGAADVVVRRLPHRVGSVLVGVACLALLVSGFRYSLRDHEPVLAQQRAEVAAVLEVLPGASMLSVEAPQPLVMAHRVNPTQHQMFRLGLESYVDRTWPGGLAGYASWISERRPTIVAVGRGAHYDWLQPTLDANYIPFGTSRGWYWYVDRATPPDTVTRLEEAVGG